MTADDLVDRVTADDLIARLIGEGLVPTSWSNGPGDRYGAHAHDYDKVLVVASGSIVFQLPRSGAAYRMDKGDRLDLPAGHAHSAVVGDRGVTCLEAHLPRGSLQDEPVHRPGWARADATGGEVTTAEGRRAERA